VAGDILKLGVGIVGGFYAHARDGNNVLTIAYCERLVRYGKKENGPKDSGSIRVPALTAVYSQCFVSDSRSKGRHSSLKNSFENFEII
jgi:hypothetical protein